MANRAAIAGALLLVAGGGAAAYSLSRETSDVLDAAGRALVKDVAAARHEDPVDREACGKLLREILAHPRHDSDESLIRSRAWLQLLTGRSVQAWNLIEPYLGVDATPEDDLLGARILERRFADTGKPELAHRGATLARAHFDATGTKSSLFLAWQLEVRRENVDRRGELARLFVERFGDSVEARLVKVLVNYPGLREDAPEAHQELLELESEFPTIPAELDLALAWFEVQDPQTFRSCLDRVARVLGTFQSSITARSLGGIVAFRLGEWGKSKAWLDALLRQYPKHSASKLWAVLAADAAAKLEKKNG